MTSLVLHSFKLHQQAADLLFPHCFHWDDEKRVWKYEADTRRLLPYYILHFGILGFIGCLCDLFLIGATILDPKLFKMNQVIIYICIFGGIPIIFLEDMLMYFSGKEFLAVVNWSLNLKMGDLAGINKDSSLKDAVMEEIGKFKKGKPIDLYGIVMNYIVVSYIFFATVIPLLAVYEDWDPGYLFFLAIDSPKILGGFGFSIASNPILKAVRFVSISILSQSAFMSTRAFTLILLSLAQTMTKVLRHLLRMRVTQQQVRNYREFWLCYRLLDHLLRLLVGGYLFLVFFFLVLSFSITILGWKFLPLDIYTFLPSLGLTLMCFVVFSFDFGCLIVGISKSILRKWKYQTRSMVSRSRMTRILKSLRLLYLPVGDVGKMDKEMRMEYFQQLLYYIMNFLIALRDIVH